MAIKTGIILSTLLLGCLAVPVKEQDMSIFFDNTDPAARIVGGNLAAEGSHPWMVAITDGRNSQNFICGGSVVSQRTVLTAAHCIAAVRGLFGSLSSNLRVHVGSNRWNSPGQTLALNGFAMHPQYTASTIRNDIGTLFTSTVIQFNANVRAIALNFNNIGAGVETRTAGWGRNHANGPLQVQLMEVLALTVDNNVCVSEVARIALENRINAPPVDPISQICTFHSPGHGTCRGDSGSPLVNIADGQQIGLVSWGIPCAVGAPDMFVRISSFQSWIEQNTRH